MSTPMTHMKSGQRPKCIRSCRRIACWLGRIFWIGLSCTLVNSCCLSLWWNRRCTRIGRGICCSVGLTRILLGLLSICLLRPCGTLQCIRTPDSLGWMSAGCLGIAWCICCLLDRKARQRCMLEWLGLQRWSHKSFWLSCKLSHLCRVSDTHLKWCWKTVGRDTDDFKECTCQSSYQIFICTCIKLSIQFWYRRDWPDHTMRQCCHNKVNIDRFSCWDVRNICTCPWIKEELVVRIFYQRVAIEVRGHRRLNILWGWCCSVGCICSRWVIRECSICLIVGCRFGRVCRWVGISGQFDRIFSRLCRGRIWIHWECSECFWDRVRTGRWVGSRPGSVQGKARNYSSSDLQQVCQRDKFRTICWLSSISVCLWGTCWYTNRFSCMALLVSGSRIGCSLGRTCILAGMCILVTPAKILILQGKRNMCCWPCSRMEFQSGMLSCWILLSQRIPSTGTVLQLCFRKPSLALWGCPLKVCHSSPPVLWLVTGRLILGLGCSFH